MKKIILGLFLTVGISSMALAGNNSGVFETKSETITTNNEQGNVEIKKILTYNYVDNFLFSCTIAIHTKISDKCGNVITTRKESFPASGSACNGFEGGISFVMKNESIDTGSCKTLGQTMLEAITDLF